MSRGRYKTSLADVIITTYALYNPTTQEWKNGSDVLAYALDKSSADWFVMEYNPKVGWQVVADPRKTKLAKTAGGNA